jgi:hypothetical protein
MGKQAWQIGTLALSLALVSGLMGTAARADILDQISVTFQVSPRLPTTRDPVRLSASITWHGCPIVFEAPVVEPGNQIVLRAAPINPVPCPSPGLQTSRYTGTLPPLPRDSYTAVLRFTGLNAAEESFTVSEPGPDLFLLGGRFVVNLSWLENGKARSAFAVPLTGQSGYFWFFDSRNIEVTVKILDGRFVNGHFWVFVASMTDVPFTLSVGDSSSLPCNTSPQCPSKSYVSPAGKNTNFIDVTAF